MESIILQEQCFGDNDTVVGNGLDLDSDNDGAIYDVSRVLGMQI